MSELLISHDALLALCTELLWAKYFLKRIPKHFWTLQSRHYVLRTYQHVSTDCFEKNFEEKTSFCLASHKRNLLALSHFFWIWVFI